MEKWTCSCGQVNSGGFCIDCGKVRPKAKTTPQVQPAPKKEEPPKQVEIPVAPAPAKQEDAPSPSLVATSNPTVNTTAKSTDKIKNVLASNKKILFGVLGCIVLIAVLFAAFSSKDKTSSHQTAGRTGANASTQMQSQTKPQTSSQPQQKPVEQKKRVPEMPSDLGLGGVCIGYEKNKLFDIWGRGQEEITPERTTYEYPDMKVWITDGRVSAIISKTRNVDTKRGIHQGSSFQEVLNAYGNNYSSFSHEGMMLYEYPMQSLNQWNCMLRFAIKNNQVDYISVRAVFPERTTTPADSIVKPRIISRLKSFEPQINAAASRFQQYHQAITNRKYNDAYDCYTSEGQRRRGARENFANGYENTVSSNVTSLKALEASNDRVVFEYTLEATDKKGTGQIGQKFLGNVEMKLENGIWGIERNESQKLER